MLTALSIFCIAYIVGSLAYIRHLHNRMRGYENVWEQIESIADKNQDGTFTINIQHLEEARPNDFPRTELHDNDEVSSIVELTTDDSGPKAA